MKNILNIVLIVVVVGVIAFIIKNNNSKKEEVDQNQTASTDLIQGCYVYTIAKDVYSLNIESQTGDKVSGTLSYNNFEKDSSMGTINGVYTNDILLANYTFNSEGMHSVRQVIFKKVGASLVQGFGDVEYKDGVEYFKDTSKVEFNVDGLVFSPSDKCSDINADIVRTVVLQFGSQLQMVSLLASKEDVKKAMDEQYAPFVSSDLLKKWQDDPTKAPGKTVSSPWPNNISIDSVEKIDSNFFMVTGEVIETTSAPLPNDIASKYKVSMKLEKINGDWMIVDFKKL